MTLVVSCDVEANTNKSYSFTSDNTHNFYYYIDTDGNLASENAFVIADDFNDEGVAYVRAYVKKNHNAKAKAVYGYIDNSFRFIGDEYWESPIQGDGFHTSDNNNGIYMRTTSGEYDELVLMDSEMNEIAKVGDVEAKTAVTCNISDNELIALSNNEGYMGFINKKGEWVIEPQYYFADIFNNGYAAARDANGLFGLIDEKGEWVIAPQYNSIYYGFDCSYFRADIDEDDNYIYINVKNERLNDKTYHGHTSEARFEEGLCAIYDDETGLLGFMNEEGEYAISPQFKEAYNFNNGIAAVRKEIDGKDAWGYIDKSGNVVIDYQYEAAGNFSSDGIAVVKNGGKWGYIKTDGSWLLKPQFDDAHSFSNGYATVKLNSGQTIQK